MGVIPPDIGHSLRFPLTLPHRPFCPLLPHFYGLARKLVRTSPRTQACSLGGAAGATGSAAGFAGAAFLGVAGFASAAGAGTATSGAGAGGDAGCAAGASCIGACAGAAGWAPLGAATARPSATIAAVVVATAMVALIALRARPMKTPSCNGASGPRRPGVYPPNAMAKPQIGAVSRNPNRRSRVPAFDPSNQETRRWRG